MGPDHRELEHQTEECSEEDGKHWSFKTPNRRDEIQSNETDRKLWWFSVACGETSQSEQTMLWWLVHAISPAVKPARFWYHKITIKGSGLGWWLQKLRKNVYET